MNTKSVICKVGILLVDKQLGVGKEYVSSVDEYLEDKDLKDYPYLALSRDLWAGYCASQAVLDDDSEEISYWSSTHALIDADNIDSFLIKNDSAQSLSELNSAGIICQAERIDYILGIVPVMSLRVLISDTQGTAFSADDIDLIGFAHRR